MADGSEEIAFVKRKRGTVMFLEGRQYYRHRGYKNGHVTWKCTQAKKVKCRGSVTLKLSRVWGDDNVVYNIALLKRREVIPLSQIGRRVLREEDLNYRKTKDIQDHVKDKRFDEAESLWREAKIAENKDQLEKIQREIRWLTMQNEDGIGIGI